MATGHNRRSVFHGNTIDARTTSRGEHQLISQRGCHLAMWRSAGEVCGPGRRTDQLVAIVGDRAYLAHCAVETRLPPFVQRNAVSIGVSARADSGVSRGGDEICIVVVAVG